LYSRKSKAGYSAIIITKLFCVLFLDGDRVFFSIFLIASGFVVFMKLEFFFTGKIIKQQFLVYYLQA